MFSPNNNVILFQSVYSTCIDYVFHAFVVFPAINYNLITPSASSVHCRLVLLSSLWWRETLRTGPEWSASLHPVSATLLCSSQQPATGLRQRWSHLPEFVSLPAHNVPQWPEHWLGVYGKLSRYVTCNMRFQLFI